MFSVEIGGIRVWLTLVRDGRDVTLGIPVEMIHKESDEEGGEAEVKAYFKTSSETKYAINIQSDSQARECQVYRETPAGHKAPLILNCHLRPGVPQFCNKHGKAQYYLGDSIRGKKLETSRRARLGPSMGNIMIHIQGVSKKYTFIFRFFHAPVEDRSNSLWGGNTLTGSHRQSERKPTISGNSEGAAVHHNMRDERSQLQPQPRLEGNWEKRLEKVADEVEGVKEIVKVETESSRLKKMTLRSTSRVLAGVGSEGFKELIQALIGVEQERVELDRERTMVEKERYKLELGRWVTERRRLEVEEARLARLVGPCLKRKREDEDDAGEGPSNRPEM